MELLWEKRSLPKSPVKNKRGRFKSNCKGSKPLRQKQLDTVYFTLLLIMIRSVYRFQSMLFLFYLLDQFYYSVEFQMFPQLQN